MQVLIVCLPGQVPEWGTLPEGFFCTTELADKPLDGYHAVIDLLFEENAAAHTPVLEKLGNTTVIVSAPCSTGSQLPAHFIRINGWPYFLQGALVEACGQNEAAKTAAEAVFSAWGKRLEWVPDVPGMVSARIICAIINEAYFAFSEGVASREAIDTAMKLGTAYPYGPFEWAQKIGVRKVHALLTRLAAEESRYGPAALLQQEAEQDFGA